MKKLFDSTESLVVHVYLAFGLLLGVLPGCAPFQRGVADGFSAGAAGSTPPALPASGDGGDILGYGVGALAAYIVGSMGKAYVRRRLEARAGEGDAE